MNRPGPPGSLAALRRALDAGETSAVSLAERCLARIATSTLNAFVDVRPEATLEQARAADERLARGDRAPLLGVPVAYDFRSADVRAGGQGAPLAGIYHQALLRRLGTHGEVAVLNLGGVANVTYWDGGDTLIAFDTGPANAPLNDFMKERGLGSNVGLSSPFPSPRAPWQTMQLRS